jgi:nucleoside-diphosphate-sugar epimerase
MRILIAGSGYVGCALAELLNTTGDHIVTLNRSDASPFEHAHQHCRADLTLPSTLTALKGDFDAVAYTVGPDESTDAGYERAYIIGLRNLLHCEALQSATRQKPRVVVTTSTAVYGQRGGEWVDETSDTWPPDFRGKRLLEAESLLHAWSPNTTSLRLGGIYGPGRHRLVTSVRDGSAKLGPSGADRADGPFINRLHRDDCAGVLAHLLKMDESPPVLVGVDDEPATANTVKAYAAERLGVTLRHDDAPPNERTLSRGRGKRCRNTKLHETGYVLRYPTYRDGYRALIDSQAL